MPQSSLIQYDFKEIRKVYVDNKKPPVGTIIEFKGVRLYFTGRVRNRKLPKEDTFFRKFGGFGISSDVFRKCLSKEIMVSGILIEFRDNEHKSLLFSTVDDWFNKGINYTDPTVLDKRMAEQKVLPKKYMKEFSEGLVKISSETARKPEEKVKESPEKGVDVPRIDTKIITTNKVMCSKCRSDTFEISYFNEEKALTGEVKNNAFIGFVCKKCRLIFFEIEPDCVDDVVRFLES